jgi:hypothetical protein
MKDSTSRTFVKEPKLETGIALGGFLITRPSASAAAVEALKRRLLREKAITASDAVVLSGLEQAAEEAASLAWATPYPLLVLPEVFAEKAAEACFRSQQQSELRQRSKRIVAPATRCAKRICAEQSQ